MSDSLAFHAQLATIIDILAKSAVAEISKLVDDGYALLRLEVSRSQKQNESLKTRLRMMEQRVAQGLTQVDRAGGQKDFVTNYTAVQSLERSEKISDCFLTDEGPLGEGSSITPWSEGKLAAGHGEGSLGQPDVMSAVQPVEAEEPKPKLPFIKKEKPEVDLSNGAVEWRAASTEKHPVQKTQNKAANHTEELTEQHRTRHGVWEVSGLESALKAEGQNECVEPVQHRGTEHRAGGLSTLDSEFVTFERPGQLESCCTQENVEDACDNPSEINSELRLVKMEDTEQTRAFWNMGSRSEMFEMQQSSTVAPYAAVRGNITLLHSGQPDRNGCVSYAKKPLPSGRPMAVGAVGARKERHICKYCGKSCTRASDLKVHQRVHTGEKPFSCTQCGKRFSQSCSLKKHQIVHSGEKPFRCLQCGKQFSDSSNLRKHRSIHTGERPFSCSLCGKRFKQSCSLKTHMKIHTGEKSLSCAYCGNTFASEYSLKLHHLKNHMAPYSIP